jgi:hypothetical protein
MSMGGTATVMEGDDGIDCTLDKCDEKGCTHVPRHFKCDSNELCVEGIGCTGRPCRLISDCVTDDPCVTYSACTYTLDGSYCTYEVRDTDLDGAYPVECGGDDCDDRDYDKRGPSPEVCDGKDNDCDGVVDPPEASGCMAPQVCTAGKCDCPAPGHVCLGLDGCIDLSSDIQHCGNCGTACDADQICTDGKCMCGAGKLRCDGVCIDVTADPNNCGACHFSCGGAQCVGGGCTCGAGRDDCNPGAAFDCRATDSDPLACGSCIKKCLPASGCNGGACDAEVQSVVAYGAVDALPTASQLVADAGGNFFAALSATGDYRALPSRQTSLWSSDQALIKLDKNAAFVWAVPSNFPILAVAASGSDVWIGIAGDAAIQVGEKSFALAAQHLGLAMLLKLDGTTGAILASERFDFSARPYYSRLLVDSDGVWVTFGAGGTVDYLGTNSAPPGEPYTSVLFHVGAPEPRWLPGSVMNLALDDNGKIVVGDLAPGYGTSFSFGGDTFTIGKDPRAAAARYTKDLVHEASFILPADEDQLSTGLPLGTDVLFVNASRAHFVTYDFTGKLLASSADLFRLNQSGLQQSGSKVAGYGYVGDQGLQVDGRNFAKETSYWVNIDSAKGVIDRSFGIPSTFSNGIRTGIAGAVMDATGSSVLVATFFDEELILGGSIYSQPGYRGIAFVKMKLRAP